jgi:hypothetical protein
MRKGERVMIMEGKNVKLGNRRRKIVETVSGEILKP